MLTVLFYVAVIVIMFASMWKIFEKAGRPGWEGIIPIYNVYIMTKIVGKPGWWVIMFFIPILNIVFMIWLYNMLSKSFGKEEGFTIGLILLGFIFFPILAFGDAQYQGPYGDQAAFKAYGDKGKFDFEGAKAI
jgi:uncharacterized protein DUF5684